MLHDEVRELGFERSYQRFTAELRGRSLRPVCPDCAGAHSRARRDIEHEPGEGLRWDWVVGEDHLGWPGSGTTAGSDRGAASGGSRGGRWMRLARSRRGKRPER